MAVILSPEKSECLCIAICGSDVLLKQDNSALDFADLLHLRAQIPDSLLFEEPCSGICALGFNTTEALPLHLIRLPLRAYFALHGEMAAMPYFRAKALYEWLSRNRFCPKCGNKLVPGTSPTETYLECPSCKNIIFPRIEPCIIVLVSKGDDILLALHRQRTTQYHSCLAGFIEAGESVEHAVRREIFEETGIHVRNIQYFGSQSWPFPTQLMLGFTAEYESGEIKIQENELQSAAWFPRNDCPATPPAGSLAYCLIHNIRE